MCVKPRRLLPRPRRSVDCRHGRHVLPVAAEACIVRELLDQAISVYGAAVIGNNVFYELNFVDLVAESYRRAFLRPGMRLRSHLAVRGVYNEPYREGIRSVVDADFGVASDDYRTAGLGDLFLYDAVNEYGVAGKSKLRADGRSRERIFGIPFIFPGAEVVGKSAVLITRDADAEADVVRPRRIIMSVRIYRHARRRLGTVLGAPAFEGIPISFHRRSDVYISVFVCYRPLGTFISGKHLPGGSVGECRAFPGMISHRTVCDRFGRYCPYRNCQRQSLVIYSDLVKAADFRLYEIRRRDHTAFDGDLLLHGAVGSVKPETECLPIDISCFENIVTDVFVVIFGGGSFQKRYRICVLLGGIHAPQSHRGDRDNAKHQYRQ